MVDTSIAAAMQVSALDDDGSLMDVDCQIGEGYAMP